MSSQTVSPIRKAWYKWKSLKLPWRKRFLVGLDLQGNTFWEFKDAITSNRMRRIVQYPHATHYSEINISPQWHQWLRHTRFEPPSLAEQSQDLVRQEQLKVLAARVDARWAAKPSFLDKPERQQALPATAIKASGGYGGEVDGSGRGLSSAVSGVEDALGVKVGERVLNVGETANYISSNVIDKPEQKKSQLEEKEKEDPWKQARGGPSEEWQPQSWGGETATRRG